MKTVLLEHNTVWGVNSRDEIYFKSHPDDPVLGYTTLYHHYFVAEKVFD